ncbi:MAG: TonB-dependent receptor [Kiritimatiellae bacterium]|nr:TonB-dependent receptor [Kiritimatiellia bacterium]
MALLASLTVAIARGQSTAPRGGIRGVVYDADFAGPVPQAAIRLLESPRETFSDRDGGFVITDLPPGAYTVVVSKPGFVRQVVTGVVVMPGAMADVTVQLRGEVVEMEEFVVRDLDLQDTATEAGMLTLRQESLTMQDTISREIMSRAGASDVAGALRLVVGATVVEGKYATVRGLGDRYVGATVNGLRVPSADPKRRAVHLDVFPAGTVEGLSVFKTFTPDLPGDFTGGGVDIRTVRVPEEPFARVGFSREVNQRVSGKPGYITYEGGGINRWGRHRGARDMVEGMATMEKDGLADRGVASYHQEKPRSPRDHDRVHLELDRIVRGVAPAMGIQRTRVPDGNHGYDVALGTRFGLGGNWQMGALAALTYSKKYWLHVGPDNVLRMQGGGPDPRELTYFRREVGTEELKWSELLTLGLERDDAHRLSFTAMRNRAVTDRAAFREQFHDTNTPVWTQIQSIHYTERPIDILQFTGEHKWGERPEGGRGWELGWGVGRNTAEQEEPDVRMFRNVVHPRGGGIYEFQPRQDGASGADEESSTRIWRNTREINSQYGLRLGIPLGWRVPDWDVSFMGFGDPNAEWPKEDIRLNIGLGKDWTRRHYRQNSFFYMMGAQMPPVYTGPVRSDFPPGPAGRRAFEAARAAWFASPAGQAYLKGLEDTARDNALRTLRTNTLDVLWTDVFTAPDRIGIGDYKNSLRWHLLPKFYDVDYEGLQHFQSGFWSLEVPVSRQLRLIGGMRLETTEMRVDPTIDSETIDPQRAFLVPVPHYITNAAGEISYYYQIEGVPKEKAAAEISQSDWLRSWGAIWDIAPGMTLRLNWSQTIARPTFLEIAPVITPDYIEGDSFIGNRDLRISHIVNRDLRWEWIQGPDDVLAFSVFDKDVTDPIEKETFGYLSESYTLAINYPRGRVEGFEVEARRRMEFLPPPFDALRVGVNYARLRSWVEMPERLVNAFTPYGLPPRERRPMEGQPEYLFNFQLLYDIERWGTSFGWFYTIRGDMLKSGAAIGESGATPDIMLLKQPSVGISISQKIGSRVKVTFRAQNLLDPPVREVYRIPGQEDVMRRQYREGVRYSIGFSAEF